MVTVSKLKRSDLIMFFERLDSYISSGLTLNKSLLIAEEGVAVRQKNMIKKVRLSVESGTALSRALGKFLRIPDTISSLVANGEASGRLSEALKNSQQLLEREDELRKKCLAAMAYPAVIGIFSLVLTLGLMRGVMPQIMPMLKGLNVRLPLLTRIVMVFSNGLLLYGLSGFSLILILSFFCLHAYKRSESFKKFIQSFLIRIPLVGNLFYRYSFSLFLSAMGSLVVSGLSSDHAYENAANALDLKPLKDVLIKEVPSVRVGVPIGLAIGKMKNIPSFVAPLVSAGEVSGTLGKSLLRGAFILDRDLEHSLKKLTALVEPVMMTAMGLVVGAIALSIMLPIYDISKVLQK